MTEEARCEACRLTTSPRSADASRPCSPGPPAMNRPSDDFSRTVRHGSVRPRSRPSGAWARVGPVDGRVALGDPNPGVRRSTCELATRLAGTEFTPSSTTPTRRSSKRRPTRRASRATAGPTTTVRHRPVPPRPALSRGRGRRARDDRRRCGQGGPLEALDAGAGAGGSSPVRRGRGFQRNRRRGRVACPTVRPGLAGASGRTGSARDQLRAQAVNATALANA